MSIENHMSPAVVSPEAFQYFGLLVVKPFLRTRLQLNSTELQAYNQWASSRTDSGIIEHKSRFHQEYPRWQFSFRLTALDEADAAEAVAITTLDGLATAGIDIPDLEYVGSHLTSYETIKADEGNITDQRYDVSDELFAQAAFHKARNLHAEMAALLG